MGKTVSHNPGTPEQIALFYCDVVIIGAWTFPGFLLWFALAFTGREGLLKKWWVYGAIFFIPAGGILQQWAFTNLLLYVKRPYGWGLQWTGAYWNLLLVPYFLLAVCAAVGLMLHFAARTGDQLKRKQGLIIGVGTILPFLLGYLTNIILPPLGVAPVPDLAQNTALIWAFGLVYAIVKYRFLVISPETAAEHILSTMADALILAEPRGRIVAVNQATADLLGHERRELTKMRLDDILESRSRRDLKEIWTRKVVKGRDVMLKTREGGSVPVGFSSSLLMGEGGSVVGVVCIARDITERKRYERQLRKAKEQAEQGSRAKSEFLANMSHELRTPLNHILGFTELVLDQKVGGLNETQAEYLGDVVRSGKHLLALINDILDLSKVEAGRMILELEDVDLKEVLEGSLMMVHEGALKKQIRIEKAMNGVDGIFRADERKLKQVLCNLLSNAVKFSPQGAVVTLRADMVAAPASEPPVGGSAGDQSGPIPKGGPPAEGPTTHLEVSVEDEGVGIRPEDLERIFNRFEQAGGPSYRRSQGTGLGLSLTRELVRLQGGRIRAESEGEGKGSRFRVVIPIGRAG
jgi:PAS domain S-box-containing protein